MMEPAVTQHILIFNIRPSQQLKWGGGLGGGRGAFPTPLLRSDRPSPPHAHTERRTHTHSSHIIACEWDPVVLLVLAPPADAPPLPVPPRSGSRYSRNAFRAAQAQLALAPVGGELEGSRCDLRVEVRSGVTSGQISSVDPVLVGVWVLELGWVLACVTQVSSSCLLADDVLT